MQGEVKRKKKRSRKAKRRKQSACGPDSGVSGRMCSSKDSVANKVFNDSSAEQSSQVAHQSRDADHDVVEIAHF